MINAQMMPSMLPMAGGFTYEEVQSLPAMTGPSSPSGYEIDQSSSFSGSFPGWKAFDQIKGSESAWVSASGSASNSWIRRKTPNAIRVWKYRITWENIAGGAGSAPRAFSLQGSTDGASWATLDTQSGVTSWTTLVPKEYEIGLEPDPYLYHRLLITEVDGASFALVGELELLQALS